MMFTDDTVSSQTLKFVWFNVLFKENYFILPTLMLYLLKVFVALWLTGSALLEKQSYAKCFSFFRSSQVFPENCHFLSFCRAAYQNVCNLKIWALSRGWNVKSGVPDRIITTTNWLKAVKSWKAQGFSPSTDDITSMVMELLTPKRSAKCSETHEKQLPELRTTQNFKPIETAIAGYMLGYICCFGMFACLQALAGQQLFFLHQFVIRNILSISTGYKPPINFCRRGW